MDQKINTLVQTALAMAAKSHAWHLSVTGLGSYAQHLAYGSLYEYFHDAADKLSESAQGAGLEPKFSAVSFKFCPLEDAIPDIEDYIQLLETTQRSIKGNDWLNNIIQEIQGELNAHLYKLKRLS